MRLDAQPEQTLLLSSTTDSSFYKARSSGNMYSEMNANAAVAGADGRPSRDFSEELSGDNPVLGLGGRSFPSDMANFLNS